MGKWVWGGGNRGKGEKDLFPFPLFPPSPTPISPCTRVTVKSQILHLGCAYFNDGRVVIRDGKFYKFNGEKEDSPRAPRPSVEHVE